MASAISYELFNAKKGAANGIASLDSNAQVPVAQLPAGSANGVASLDGSTKVPVGQLPAGSANGVASLDGNTKVPVAQLPAGVASGVASLDSNTKVPIAQLPAGTANGVASLNGSGVVPESQLPAGVVNNYKGEYADLSALTTAHATGSLADYAYVTAANAYYYWNSKLTTAAWVNQQIPEADYIALTAAQKGAVPYIVIA